MGIELHDCDLANIPASLSLNGKPLSTIAISNIHCAERLLRDLGFSLVISAAVNARR